MKVISTQNDWEQLRNRFSRSSHYRDFSTDCSFDPTSKLRLTGMPMGEALPSAKPGGPRWTIFEKAIVDGRTVEAVNNLAQQVARQNGATAERDGDIFIALFTGYATLEPANG